MKTKTISKPIFNINDSVWYSNRGVPTKGKIQGLVIAAKDDKKEYKTLPYIVLLDAGWSVDAFGHYFRSNLVKVENEVFSTKPELVKYMKELAKKEQPSEGISVDIHKVITGIISDLKKSKK